MYVIIITYNIQYTYPSLITLQAKHHAQYCDGLCIVPPGQLFWVMTPQNHEVLAVVFGTWIFLVDSLGALRRVVEPPWISLCLSEPFHGCLSGLRFWEFGGRLNNFELFAC